MSSRVNLQVSSSGLSAWLRQHPISALVYLIVLPLMACLVLVLPPISLPSRVASAGFVPIPKGGATLSASDGTELVVPQNAVAAGSALRMNSLRPEDPSLRALTLSLPAHVEPRSSLYKIEVQGEAPKQATLVVPIPEEAEPYDTLDLFGYYAQRWFKLPFVLLEDDGVIESQLNFVPEAAVVVQTFPRAPVISAQVSSRAGLPEPAEEILVRIEPTGLHLADEGSIAGEPVNAPQTDVTSNFAVLPIVSNVDANGARVDLAGNMMADPTQREAHINALVDLAVQRVYRGYDISYEGLGVGDEELYTSFIKDLARALHAKQKTLTVTLPAPVPLSEEEFDTAGYNWALLGRYADAVRIPLMSDPRAYEGEPSLQEQYLRWAVSQIDRTKIQLIVSAMGRDTTKSESTPVALGDALNLLGPITLSENAAPGSVAVLEMPNLFKSGGIQIHEPSGLFYFNYVDKETTPHTVWLENAGSLAKQAELALKYGLSGLALVGFDDKDTIDERAWTVLENFASMQPTIVENALALVWSIDGKVLGKTTVREPRIQWETPNEAGQHQVQVALSLDGGVSAGPAKGGQVVRLAAARPTPKPTEPPPTTAPEPEPTEPPQGQENTPPPPKPTAAPAAPTNPPPPKSNFAGQNMFGYGIQLDWTNKDRDTEFSQVQQLGFNWAKVQVRWCDIEGSPGNADLSGPDDFLSRAGARGIKVVFSVVCAPAWTRADGGAGGSGPPDDMQRAADFMGGLAGYFCDKHNGALGAIEVWNEHNLLTEWHGKPLSAQLYMDMLKRSYTKIKEACPRIVVVSGAPTPTGWNDGVVAIDDAVFLEQMYQNGLKDYSDAIGAHPSGYNVPALCDIREPSCNRPEASFRAPFENRHPSWSFMSTMRRYREIMVQYGDANKQIWPTEFGWPTHTGGTCGGGPCHPAGADNSPEQAARWYVEAYQWAKQQGWVGVMVAWQLDFDRGELDAFRILGKPAFDALAAMPK